MLKSIEFLPVKRTLVTVVNGEQYPPDFGEKAHSPLAA